MIAEREAVASILVVEDDPHTAELERRALVRTGKRVRTVRLVSEALAAMREEPFAAILLDYRLPDGEPWPVLEAARQALPPIPVILVTAMGDERVAAEVIHRGGADYLIKAEGFWEQLTGAVDRVLKLVRIERTNARLAALVESSDDAIFSQSLAGEVLSWNAGAARLFGYTAEEVVGRPVSLLSPADRAEEDAEIAAGIRRGEATRQLETTRIRKDGSAVAVSLTVSPVFDSGGKVVSAASISRDITARQRTERWLHLAVEAARMGVWDLDLVSGEATRSLRHDQIFGYETLQPRWTIETFSRHVLPEDRAALKLSFERAGESGELHLECRIRWPDDSVHWIAADGTVLRDAEGRAVRVLGVITEVTARKQAEESLRESAELDRALFLGSPLPMWLYDIDSLRILSVNDAAVRHYGYAREELLAMTLRDVHSPDDLPALAAAHQEEVPEYRRAGIFRHRKKDGSTIRVEIHVHDVWTGGRRSRLALLQDVTGRQLLEDQLRQSQKMEAIGQLAGGIAHDFNNVLTIVNGYTDHLLGRWRPGAEGYEELSEIRKAGERAASLTRQLLAFSRRRDARPEILDLNAVVTDMDKLLRRLIGEHIDLVAVLSPVVGCVRVDASQIEQVLMNLAVNSRDAMAEGGTLSIETASVEVDEAFARSHVDLRPGPYVVLTVTDTGCGIDPQSLPRIFEPFFTTKEVGRGTGLGLATVFGIVKQSGGHVYVESEQDQGTSFTIYLPRVDSPAAVRHALPPGVATRTGGETLLVVEDEDQVRRLTCLVLQRAGYDVLEAAAPERALSLVRERAAPIDLLITDVVMPGMGGPELVQAIARERPGLRTLFLSGYTGRPVTAGAAIEVDAPLLEKPFTPQSLLSKVREVLDGGGN